MADVTYVIRIRDETGDKNSQNGQASANNKNGGVAPTSSGENASGFSLSNKTKAKLGYVAVRKIGHRVATTIVSRVGTKTGNTTRQEQMQFALSSAERALNIGTAVLVGAITGNPLAVMAGVGSVISWGTDIAVARENLNLERQVEYIGISQANIRAGAGGDRYGKTNF